MLFDTEALFNAVKSSANESKNNDSSTLFKEVLKFGPEYIDKKLILRLVPYVKEGNEGMKKTFFHFIRYSWKGSDGAWHGVLSPRTFGGRCSIGDYSYRIRYKGSQVEKDDLKERLFFKEGWYVNVYVIDDPVHPENNGNVKILSIGKRLNDYILSALNGALDDEWTAQAAQYTGSSEKIEVGKRIFDLTPNGVNFVLSVTKNTGGFNDYTSSRFVPCNKTDARQVFSEARQREICESAYDVTQLERVTTDEENMKLFRETFFEADSPKVTPPVVNTVKPIDDPVPTFAQPTVKSNADEDMEEFLRSVSGH